MTQRRSMKPDDLLGVLLIVAFMAALGMLFMQEIRKENEQLIAYMLGQLSGFVSAVVAFRYGRNRLNEQATANTGEAFRAMKATADALTTTPSPVPPVPEPTK